MRLKIALFSCFDPNCCSWAAKRNELKERASKLRQIGETIEKENFKETKLAGSDKKLFNKFKTAVYLLEKDYEVLRVRKYEKGGNILYYLLMGVLGVIGIGVSLLWIVHTIVFTFLHNMSPFLNTMLVGLDKTLPLLGIVGYGTFSFYLLWCAPPPSPPRQRHFAAPWSAPYVDRRRPERC